MTSDTKFGLERTYAVTQAWFVVFLFGSWRELRDFKIFCLLQKTNILLQRCARQASWPSPYLDAFGEEVGWHYPWNSYAAHRTYCCVSYKPLKCGLLDRGNRDCKRATECNLLSQPSQSTMSEKADQMSSAFESSKNPHIKAQKHRAPFLHRLAHDVQKDYLYW